MQKKKRINSGSNNNKNPNNKLQINKLDKNIIWIQILKCKENNITKLKAQNFRKRINHNNNLIIRNLIYFLVQMEIVWKNRKNRIMDNLEINYKIGTD